MFVKRVHHPLFFFPRWAPKISNTSTRWNRAFGNRAPVFYAPKRMMCGNPFLGGDVVCIYRTPTKKGARKFQVAVGKRLGDGRGSFEMKGVDGFCK